MHVNVSPPEKFHELLQFNFLPTRYLDSSWWQPGWLNGALLSPAQFPDRAQFWLSRFFLERSGLAGDFDFDFAADEKRIALLSGKQLQRLTCLAGLTLQSQRIARVIRGSDRMLIKNTIGEDDYFFAIKRGAMLLEEARFQSLPEPDAGAGFDTLAEDCQRVGIGSLATAASGFSSAFIRRLQLKFPRPMVENHWQAEADEQDAHARLLLKLAREVERV